MTKYRVLQEFTTDNGTVYNKMTSFDNEQRHIPEDELSGYLDAGWIEEEEDAAVEGDEGGEEPPVPLAKAYKPDEGGGAPA